MVALAVFMLWSGVMTKKMQLFFLYKKSSRERQTRGNQFLVLLLVVGSMHVCMVQFSVDPQGY